MHATEPEPDAGGAAAGGPSGGGRRSAAVQPRRGGFPIPPMDLAVPPSPAAPRARVTAPAASMSSGRRGATALSTRNPATDTEEDSDV